MKRKLWLILYYAIARYMPSSHSKYSIGGGKFRLLCCKHIFKYCAPDANIERNATFGNGYGVEIGNRSSIGINCHVPNDIKIGKDVMMGPCCFFVDNITHGYDRVDVPMIEQRSKRIIVRTTIGDDVWIGRQCLILPGKSIGNHSIIGAGCVVSKDIPDYVIAAGNPVRVVKERK